ncbi:MAG: hypothetical protein FJ096_01270 [Deltaproteobacteria bacterium]|nr:hypothetical protein [Deltaproteobacteria bacterium]
MTSPASLAAIVSTGARTPLGLDARQSYFLLRAGFAALGEAPLGRDGAPIVMSLDAALEPTLTGSERALALATPALLEALAGLAPLAPARLGLVVCTEDERSFSEPGGLALELERAARRSVGRVTTTVCSRGGASLALALPRVLAELRAGRLDALVVGGVHTDFDPRAIAQLADEGRLFTAEHTAAVLPGEAAAFVGLAAHGPALPALAHLVGVGVGDEPARHDNDLPSAGARGLTSALFSAAEPLETCGARAGWVLDDIGFEAFRQREWQTLLVRAAQVVGAPFRLDSLAQRLGRLGAASLPLGLTLVAEAARAGEPTAEHAFVVGTSDGGERGVVAVSRADAQR